jgi:hypothetical protein
MSYSLREYSVQDRLSMEILKIENDTLLVAGFSDPSNSPVRRRNGGFPCRIWAPTVRRDKINRWN